MARSNPLGKAGQMQQRAESRATLRNQLRDAIESACRCRGDSRLHAETCIDEVLAEPFDVWPWWLDYWRGQYRRPDAGPTP